MKIKNKVFIVLSVLCIVLVAISTITFADYYTPDDFESKITKEKEYVFGRGGGEKLAEELRTEVLGQLPLQQPDWNDEDFAPSVYDADHKLGAIYKDIANKIITITTK